MIYRTAAVGFIRLLLMEYFILLFSRISYHQKYFKTINETTHKTPDFILEFYNTIFYIIPLVIYEIK
jgi:hypothetical protein